MSKKTVLLIMLPLLLTGIFGFLMPVTHASALNAGFAQRLDQKASNSAGRQDAELAKIIARADTMITTRLTSLNTLLSRVQNDTKLTGDEKTSFVTDINTTSTNLTTLKAKIDADIDITTARTDIKSIVTSYRVYLMYEPKSRLLIIVDNLQVASTTISGLVTQVGTLLTTLQGQGKNVTAEQTALTDISTQLSSMNTLLATDKSLLQNVSIATSDPQSIFVQVRKDLATARADIATIRSDFATIHTGLKPLLISTNPTATTTPIVSSPTPTP